MRKHYTFQACSLLLLGLFFASCSSTDATIPLEAEIARLQAELDQLRHRDNASERFVDSLSVEISTIQGLLDSVMIADGSHRLSGMTAVEKILFLDSLLISSQARIRELTARLELDSNQTLIQATDLLVDQLQNQVTALQGRIQTLESQNQGLQASLLVNQRQLTFTREAFEVADSSRQQLQTIVSFKDDQLAQVSRERDQAVMEKELVERNTVAISAFEKGVIYLKQVDELTNKRGKIRKRDWSSAQQLASQAREQFNKAVRLGYEDANTWLNKMLYTGIYPDLLGIEKPD